MPRAPSSGLSSLLLMAGLAFAATTTTFVTATVNSQQPLENAVDSWLSSSASADLQSTVYATTAPLSCSAADSAGEAAETLCPPPCPLQMPKTANTSTQCLCYLEESHKEKVCGHDFNPKSRRDILHRVRMRHCSEHAVDTALPEAAFDGGTAAADC
ncbi:hypothetical protein JTB14_010539 [Gonioctena quinquepunctata]|nr:hypothetical protein JTB14_010539 [Gonioctena quinquepunctata]